MKIFRRGQAKPSRVPLLLRTFSVCLAVRLRLRLGLRLPLQLQLRFHSRVLASAALVVLICLSIGCGKKHARATVPPPPEPASTQPEASALGGNGRGSSKVSSSSSTSSGGTANGKPGHVIFSETGLASWYGPPYHNHKASNGEVFDMHAMTAAHRTLPLGTVVRVTNTKTGASATVRINDRGPFIVGRVLDLSEAAAKAVDVWRPGVAEVKIEVLEAPVAINSGGRWAVQIGGFKDEDNAAALKDELAERYPAAQVQQFRSIIGSWWLRVRVAKDDRSLAEHIAHSTKSSEGAVFMVRLD